MDNKNQTCLKNVKRKINLNHNIHVADLVILEFYAPRLMETIVVLKGG